MKFKTILASTLAISALAGCVKHEIIPAPEPKVELYCHFKGKIDNTDVELTQNVQGYFLETSKSKIVPPSGPSTAVYFSEIKSAESLIAMRLNLGQVLWDSQVSSDPTAAIFNGFMSASTEPVYSVGAVSVGGVAGFEVSYRDMSGNVWLSETDAGNKIKFNNIVQESDKTGDYSKFVANFDCIVHHTFMNIDNTVSPPDTTYDPQTKTITNGVFTGWFKR